MFLSNVKLEPYVPLERRVNIIMNGKMYAQDFGLFFMPVFEFMTTDITSVPTHRMNHNATGLQYQQIRLLEMPAI